MCFYILKLLGNIICPRPYHHHHHPPRIKRMQMWNSLQRYCARLEFGEMNTAGGALTLLYMLCTS